MKWGLTKRNADSDYTVDSLGRDINSLFDDFFSLWPSVNFDTRFPIVEVDEDEKAVYVKAEIPGLDEKDLDVTLKDNMLTISGEKKHEKKEEDKDKNRIYSEVRYGSFCRTIALPEGIKADEIKAEYKNGLLKIELPKDESAKPKKIDITVN